MPSELVAGLACREARPARPLDDETVALCVHGFPESSYMWRALLDDLGTAGVRAVAPDLPGCGDSPADPPATWERHVEALGALSSCIAPAISTSSGPTSRASPPSRCRRW